MKTGILTFMFLCVFQAVLQSQTVYNVGHKILILSYEGPFHPNVSRKVDLVVALWYPTSDTEQPVRYASGNDNIETSLALSARPALEQGPYPLVIYSHGAFGWGYKGAFIAEYLAARGYVVAAPDYIDFLPPNFSTELYAGRILGEQARKKGTVVPGKQMMQQIQQFTRWMGSHSEETLDWFLKGRIYTTSFVIDQLLALSAGSGELQGLINPEAIGIMGTSAGGATALGLSGAHPDPSAIDSRIKASVIFTPPLIEELHNNIKNIHIPLLITEGEKDQPNKTSRKVLFDAANPPRYFYTLGGGTHFSFGTPNSRSLSGRNLRQFVSSDPSKGGVCQISLAFFDRHLKGNEASDELLMHPGSAWTYSAVELEEGQLIEQGSHRPKSGVAKSQAADLLQVLKRLQQARQSGNNSLVRKEFTKARQIWSTLSETDKKQIRTKNPRLASKLDMKH